MPTAEQITERVAFESDRRSRLGVPAVAAGVLYLLGAIIISSTLNGAPNVGLLQGLAPALNGVIRPPVSPRAAEVTYESHHTFGLIAGTVLTALAIALLIVVLLFVLDAARFRRPQVSQLARPLVLTGGALIALLTIANEIVLSIRRHQFVIKHDYSIHAVNAITHNVGYDVLAVLTPLAGLALVAGMIMTMLATVRVGLLPRWLGMVGGVSAVLILLPTPTFDLIPAFWLVAMGILLLGRWPKGDPPAWAAGEAVPWPSPAQLREQAQEPAGRGKSKPQSTGSANDVAPAPARPVGSSSSKRRRKRGSRR